LGEESAKLRSHHNSLVTIVSAALGGGNDKPSGPPKPKNDITNGAKSPEAAVAAINNMLKF